MSNTFLTRYLICFTVAFALLPVATAAAQPVPNAGQVAVGGEVGVFIPADEQLSSGVVGGGLLEFYVTPRVGIRGTVTAIRSGYDRRDDDDERQLRFGVDVIHNWEFGRVHPFAGGGIAMHLLRFHRDGDNEGPNDTAFGVQGLGGVEFFLNRAWTVKTEGRYQWVGDRPNLDPDGLSLTIGLKRYF
jgi:opacity protein-like surface antigen